MKNTCYDMNREVHLGRRDALMEKVSEMFSRCLKESPGSRRIQYVDSILYYLQSALDHSFLAAKSRQALPEEESFVPAVKPLVFYLHAAIALMENESRIRNRDDPLWRFLREYGGPGDAKIMTRNSRQLLEDVRLFFQLIESPYLHLKENILAGMNDSARTRHENARQSLKAHLATTRHQRHAVRRGRTSGPGLLAKYEST